MDNDDLLLRLPFLDRVALRVLYQLPQRRRSSLLHRYRGRAFHHYVRRKVGEAGFEPVEPGPAAPAGLVVQTSGLTPSAAATAGDADEYFAGGYFGVLYLLQLAEKCGFNLRTMAAALDFGCGTAKNIRLFRCVRGTRLVGADVNPAVLEWARANVPGVTFVLNELRPPIATLEDDSFDLVISSSVFTHIPLEWQDDWLREIRRLMRPGGYFVCTVAGNFHITRQLDAAQQAQLEAEGHYTLAADDPGVSFATRNVGSWDVFQTRGEVLTSFARVFTVADYVSSARGQDVLVLRKLETSGS